MFIWEFWVFIEFDDVWEYLNLDLEGNYDFNNVFYIDFIEGEVLENMLENVMLLGEIFVLMEYDYWLRCGRGWVIIFGFLVSVL